MALLTHHSVDRAHLRLKEGRQTELSLLVCHFPLAHDEEHCIRVLFQIEDARFVVICLLVDVVDSLFTELVWKGARM